MNHEAEPHKAAKPKTLAVNPQLHRYLDLIRALAGKQFKELVEPPLWDIVRENKARIEQATGVPVIIPDPEQEKLEVVGA